MNEYKNIILNIDEGLATITMNRPKALNALNTEIINELDNAITKVESASVKLLVIKGEGKAFVAGADISEMATLNEEEASVYGELGQKLFRRIEKLTIPTIAAINGYALGGGCELALSCDIRIASEKAKLGQPEVGLGITPGFSGTQRLPRIVGIAKAKELIFTGKVIDAKEALSIGLVNKLVSLDEFDNEISKMTSSIMKNSLIAVKYSKQAIDEGMNNDIDTGIEIESKLFAKCFSHEDQKEGMNAFLESRKPNFK